MKRAYQRGFTAIELLTAIVVGAAIVIGGIVFVGRHVVDDSDAVKEAEKAGITEGKVIERHDLFSARHGCAYGDADAFVVEGKKADGSTVKQTVCCAAWFSGCHLPPAKK